MKKNSLKQFSNASSYNPCHNLPNFIQSDTSEDHFMKKFADTYLSKFRQLHSFPDYTNVFLAREIPVSGFGISDLLAISCNTTSSDPKFSFDSENISQQNFTIRSFEGKLHNWKKGLAQAHRYSYFSNASILVLPSDRLAAAIKNLSLFKILKVGLWGFNLSTLTIKKIYTPRPRKSPNAKHHNSALLKAFS